MDRFALSHPGRLPSRRRPTPCQTVGQAAAAGVDRSSCIGTDASTSPRRSSWPTSGRRRPTAGRWRPIVAWATVGLHPHEARRASPPSRRCSTTPGPGTRAWSWRSASAGSTTTTSTRRAPPARGVRRPDRLAQRRGLALVVHTRDAWDDTLDILRADGSAGADRRPLLHRRARRGRVAASSSAPSCRSAGSSRSRTADDVATPPRGAPRAPSRRDRQPVPGPGAAPGRAQRAGLGRSWAAVRGRAAVGEDRRGWRRRPRQPARLFALT